jgi:hypothetical protein
MYFNWDGPIGNAYVVSSIDLIECKGVCEMQAITEPISQEYKHPLKNQNLRKRLTLETLHQRPI